MLKLVPDKNWSTVQVTVPNAIATEIESYAEEPVDQQYILAGAILFSVFKTAIQDKRTDFFEGLTGAMEYMAKINGWSDEAIMTMRSTLWRSAHGFLVNNVDGIDRGREIKELEKALTGK